MYRLRHLLALTLLLALCPFRTFGGEGVLSTAGELSAAVLQADSEGRAFALTGTVSYVSTIAFNGGMSICAEDESGAMLFRVDPGTALGHTPANGDRVSLSGTIKGFMRDRRFAVLDDCRLLDTGAPSAPQLRTLAELAGGGADYRLSVIDGILTDIAYSSVNQQWLLLLLQDKTDSLYISVPCDGSACSARLTNLLGSRVRATGIGVPYDHGVRKMIGRLFKVATADDIRSVNPCPPKDIPDYPSIDRLADLRPDDLASAGTHRAEGHVVAVRSDRTVILRTPDADYVDVDFADPAGLPAYGDYIEVAGLPDTDLFRINLFKSVWRNKEGPALPQETPLALHPSDLMGLDEDKGQKSLHCHRCYAYHGHPLTFTGLVRNISRHDTSGTLFIECEGQLIAVDTGSQAAVLNDLEVGCLVRVTGTCVLNVGARRANSMLAEITGFTLVLRTTDDVAILARPSWWTTRRLLILLGLGLSALLGVILWNVSLNRRAKAKGKELAAEQLAHVTSELKLNERTRLAVELHDALSQTLTGVSMQIDTAAGLANKQTPALTACLNLASRTIDACRTELRNTLWDLRSAALDEPSLEAAIRKTLRQNLSGIDLTVRFNVGRDRLTDNITHALLKIIRELATNALRHGKASALQIAGTFDQGNLVFSVRDNGCGFDPELAPGVTQGHFGLQGIAERIAQLNGDLTIDSTPGKGTKVCVTIPCTML